MSLVEQSPCDRSPFFDPVTGLRTPAMFRELLSHALLRTRRSPTDVAVLRLRLEGLPDLPAASESARPEPLGTTGAKPGGSGGSDGSGGPAGSAKDCAADSSREFLRLAAGRIVDCLRAGDVAARVAGADFAVLLESTWSPSDASAVAHRLLAAFRPPLVIGDVELAVTARVGVAVGARPGRAADDVVRRAEAALDAARVAEGDRICVSESAPPEISVQLLLRTADLREGLEREELEMAYQPVVEIATGRVTGFEVLVRWNHPTLGLLAPQDFLPVAESSGLIERLTERVLRRSLAQLTDWQRVHPGQSQLSASVNIAGSQLVRESFAAQVQRLLSESGINPGTLILEVDEGALRAAGATAWERLEQLRSAGVRIYLDDWRPSSPATLGLGKPGLGEPGLGEPGLSGLGPLPIDGLKLASAVVSDLPAEAALDSARAALALTFAAGFEPAVAKGVETEEQQRILSELGFQRGQGYHLGTPQDAIETGALLTD
jgi:EAL domain-containing protein (putative c-di-GMP-specific phosphodiesterase class I)/GGDEF domain-containing protein